MDVRSVKPGDLGIGKISYHDIFNGKVDNTLSMTLVQKSVVKAYQKICSEEKKNTFVPLSSQQIFDHLKDTPIKEFIPIDGINPDVVILARKGWFQILGNDQFVFTDYAKEMLYKIN